MMKMTVFRPFLFVLAALGGTGCSHQYYTSNVQQVPLFTERNQWQATGSISAGDQVTATDIGLAYSVTDHLAVMGAASWTKGTFNYNNDYMRSGYGEAAIGYFKPIDKYGVFEIYGGAGLNGQHHQYESDTTGSNLNFTKYFIQPVLGFKRGHIQAGISCRVSYLNYTKVNSNYTGDGLPEKKNYTLIEPAFTFRVGGEFAKFQFQRQLSSPFTTEKPKFYYTQSMWSVGIQFVFSGSTAPRTEKQ